MKTFMTVLNSDSVNRYGMRFAVSALESALEQSWNPGIPGFFGHDRHRPANWNVGVGVHLEPGMARLFGLIQQPENENECDQISKLCHRSISLKISEHVEPHADELLERTRSHLQGQHRWEFVECACIRNEGLGVCLRFRVREVIRGWCSVRVFSERNSGSCCVESLQQVVREADQRPLTLHLLQTS